MKRLSDILYGVSLLEVRGNTAVDITDMTFDSRVAKPGYVFIATKGTVTDGHKFIPTAVFQGTTAVVCEQFPETTEPSVTYVRVDDSTKALGLMAANFYDHPSKKLKLVAVTGTNGKTTVATLLYRMFNSMGKRSGLLSTVENRIGDIVVPATHTTPDAINLNKLLMQMVDAGCQFCFMEASSHAIEQGRIRGLEFTGAAFTNLTRDHLDYHVTFDNYIRAKQKLFDGLSTNAFALSNDDDRNGKIMLQNTKAKRHYYSLKNNVEFNGKVLENSFAGLIMNIDGVELHTALVGEFNAYNILCVYGVARLLGVDQTEALTAISTLHPAEGRFDYIVSKSDKVIGIVDYAHTPDALEKVLKTIQAIRTGNEQIITIVGCGGDRDKGKRPMMAKVAGELSDRLILTSDNPRSEDPNTILNEMKPGVPPHKATKTLSIVDRKEAIRTAVMLAQRNDIILVAGKGHEKYQEINGTKHPFDDKTILTQTLTEANR